MAFGREKNRSPKRKSIRRRYVPRIEALEDRFVPALSILDTVVIEADSTATTAVFRVTRETAGFPVSVQYSTLLGGAADASDIVETSGTLFFADDELEKQILVTVNGDFNAEGDETFFVQLTNASGTAIRDNLAKGTIRDNEFSPTGPVTPFDQDFGSGGVAEQSSISGVDVAYDSNGRLIALTTGGGGGESFRVFRYIPNGSAMQGQNPPAELMGYVSALAAFTAGSFRDQFVVVGTSAVYDGFVVVKYTNDATIDLSFGNQGIVNFDLPGSSEIAEAVAVYQTGPNAGKILIAGKSTISGPGQYTLIRLNPNGSLDTTFGTGGVAQFQILDDAYSIGGLAIGSDDTIYVSGSAFVGLSFPSMFVARLTATGSLDTTYAASGSEPGVAIIPDGDFGNGMALDSSGRAVVVGAGDFAGIIVRLTTTGEMDTTFGTDGVILVPTAVSLDDVAISPRDGAIIATGYSEVSGGDAAMVARFHANGDPDTTFDTQDGDHILVVPNSVTYDTPRGIAVSADNQIAIVGDRSVPDVSNGLFVSQIIGDRADIAVSISAVNDSGSIGANGEVLVGDILTISIVITNNGPQSVASVNVSTFAPSNGVVLSATSPNSIDPNLIVWQTGSLASGESTTLTLEVELTSRGGYSVYVDAYGNVPDHDLGNNSASEFFRIGEFEGGPYFVYENSPFSDLGIITFRGVEEGPLPPPFLPAGVADNDSFAIYYDGDYWMVMAFDSFDFESTPTKTIVVQAIDGGGYLYSQTYVVEVLDVFEPDYTNQPPIAIADNLSGIAEDSGTRIISIASLLANDSAGANSEDEYQTIVFDGIHSVIGGSAVVIGENIHFTPMPDYFGPAGFSYGIRDEFLSSASESERGSLEESFYENPYEAAFESKTATGQVRFTITEVNDPITVPNIALGSYNPVGGAFFIPPSFLLAGASPGPPNEANQQILIVGVTNVVGGSAIVFGGGIVFTPDPSFVGIASFTLIARDDGTTNGVSAPQFGSATVVAAQAPPATVVPGNPVLVIGLGFILSVPRSDVFPAGVPYVSDVAVYSSSEEFRELSQSFRVFFGSLPPGYQNAALVWMDLDSRLASVVSVFQNGGESARPGGSSLIHPDANLLTPDSPRRGRVLQIINSQFDGEDNVWIFEGLLRNNSRGNPPADPQPPASPGPPPAGESGAQSFWNERLNPVVERLRPWGAGSLLFMGLIANLAFGSMMDKDPFSAPRRKKRLSSKEEESARDHS